MTQGDLLTLWSVERFSRIGAGYIATCIVGGIAVTGGGILAPETAGALRVILFVSGLVAISIGIAGIGWDIWGWRATRATPHAPEPVYQTPKPDPASPEPSIRESDVRQLWSRAEKYARSILASDAHIELSSLRFSPDISASFAAWSKTAGRHTWVYISKLTESHSRLLNGPYVVKYDAPYWGKADRSAVREASDIVRLIRATWLRVRPFDGTLTVYGLSTPAIAEMEKIDLGKWMACREVEGEREKECFAFDEMGEIRSWKADLWWLG